MAIIQTPMIRSCAAYHGILLLMMPIATVGTIATVTTLLCAARSGARMYIATNVSICGNGR